MLTKFAAVSAGIIASFAIQHMAAADIITDGGFINPINTGDHTEGEIDIRDMLFWFTGGNNGPETTSGFLEFKNNQTRGAWQVIDDSSLTTGLQQFYFDYLLQDSNGSLDYSIRIYGFDDPSPLTNIGGNTVNNGAAASAWTGLTGTLITQIETGDLNSSTTFSPYSQQIDLGSGYDFIVIGFFAANANGANDLGFDNVSITGIPESGSAILILMVLLVSGRRSTLAGGMRRKTMK